jgi:hypothetical protein
VILWYCNKSGMTANYGGRNYEGVFYLGMDFHLFSQHTDYLSSVASPRTTFFRTLSQLLCDFFVSVQGADFHAQRSKIEYYVVNKILFNDV